MAQRKISAYWLLLIAIILLVTLALAVGKTYARYVTTAEWNTLVDTPRGQDALLLDGTQLVDLGQLSLGTTQIPFFLAEEQTENVTCGSVDGLNASVLYDETGYSLVLTLETCPAAAEVVHIPVQAGETVLGIFRMCLPAAEPEEQETEENTQEAAEDEENTEQAEEDQDAQSQIQYLQVPSQLLEGDILQIRMGVATTADRVMLIMGEGFPAGTRYSVDGGNSWYLLYFGGSMWLEAEAELTVLVDFSRACDRVLGTWVIKGESYSGEALITMLSGDVNIEAAILNGTALMSGATDVLSVNLPQSLSEYEIVSAVEILTTDETGALLYTDTTEAFALILGEENTALTVGFTGILPQAGTYRLILTWKDGEIEVRQSEISFFISYSDENTGGAE